MSCVTRAPQFELRARAGEHPHGLFHWMHAQWRLHRQFIMWAAHVKGIDNKQVVEDPNVSQFNSHRFFFLNVLTRACAEYLNFLANSPGAPSFDDPVPILARAEANIDFAWVCHFAYDAGFGVLDFLQAVRANESKRLDLLWREFFASAHTGTAHKTQYVPMSIMRVFWGMAMTPELDALYHRIRTIPSGDSMGCGVGWDMAIEMLNAAIKAHVLHQVSHAQIKQFLANWALLECVQERMRDYIYGGRAGVRRSSHAGMCLTAPCPRPCPAPAPAGPMRAAPAPSPHPRPGPTPHPTQPAPAPGPVCAQPMQPLTWIHSWPSSRR